MKNTSLITRRKFLGGMLKTALIASTAPQFISHRLLAGDTTPSKLINIAHIGVGGQGTNNLHNFLSVDICQPVAICDPYRQRREAARDIVKQARNQEPKLYNDFRELLADPGVDAVIICSPDHWHVPLGLAAVRAGKDVYIEKPLGHSLNQNMAIFKACHDNNRIFQYGTQQRSQEMLKRCVELVRNGYIGDLQHVDVWAPEGSSGGSLEEIPVPDGLDYELYIGPAPMRPCSNDRITSAGSWYCADYALGFIAGWGAHPLDIAIWGMDSDTKGDIHFKGTGVNQTPKALFNTYNTWDVNIQFQDGVDMHFMSSALAQPIVGPYLDPAGVGAGGGRQNGTTFHGSKGWVSGGRAYAAASNPDWLKLQQCEGDKRVLYHNHYFRSFIESVRDHSPSIAPVEDAIRSDALSHLSLMAIATRAEVVWDPVNYTIKAPDSLVPKMGIDIRGDWIQS